MHRHLVKLGALALAAIDRVALLDPLPAPGLPAPGPAGSHQGAAEKPKAAAAPKISAERIRWTLPPSAFGAFDTTGKAWCNQCDARVDRPVAAACKSSFCKLKAFA